MPITESPLPPPSQKRPSLLIAALMPRVLITVSGGVADYVCDQGVDVALFDHDSAEQNPEDSGGVPAHFADLVPAGSGIPIEPPSTTAPSMVAKERALANLQQSLTLATHSGLFDDMAATTHPDVINRFCDAVHDELAARQPQGEDAMPRCTEK